MDSTKFKFFFRRISLDSKWTRFSEKKKKKIGVRCTLKEPELIKEYNQIIVEQVNNGIVERIPTEEKMEKMGENVHYLSHHAVVRRDRETRKLRIVYDG